MLNIASEFTKYIVSFPPAPRATFGVLQKLDHCFASLLRGEDADTNEPLPGFENGLRAGMTLTDMVRCRSTVEQTRVLVVEVLSSADDVEEEDEETGMDTEGETDNEANTNSGTWTDDDDRLNMDVARVYEKTIVRLGERLGDVWGAVGPAPEAEQAPGMDCLPR